MCLLCLRIAFLFALWMPGCCVARSRQRKNKEETLRMFRRKSGIGNTEKKSTSSQTKGKRTWSTTTKAVHRPAIVR